MRILIVKLHALGDLVIATPAIRRLKEALPNSQLDLLTTEWTAPAALGNPCLSEIFITPDGLFFKPGLSALPMLFTLQSRLRSKSYSAAVIFHAHPAIDAFIALTGVKRRFRFSKSRASGSLWLDESRHSALTNCELIDETLSYLIGSHPEAARLADLRYEWIVTTEEKSSALHALKTHGLEPGGFVSIFPGGGSNPSTASFDRRWPVDRFAQLVSRITRDLGYKIALLGSQGDSQMAQQVCELAGVEVENLSGSLPIRVSAAVVKASVAAISIDSGPLHIAAAVGTPCVGIFGPTGIDFKLPPGPNVIGVSSEIPCSPCYFTVFKGCLFEEIRCLHTLDVEKVFQGLKAALGETTQG